MYDIIIKFIYLCEFIRVYLFIYFVNKVSALESHLNRT